MGIMDIIAKYLIIILNVFVAAIGTSWVSIGILSTIYISRLSQVFDEIDVGISVVIIIIGCIIFLVALLGCQSVLAGKPALLNSYATCMLVLSGFKMYLTLIAYYSLLDEWRIDMESILNYTFYTPEWRGVFVVIESWHSCCGTTGPNSYESMDMLLPRTCCSNNQTLVDDVNVVDDINDRRLPPESICTSEEAYGGCNEIMYSYVYLLYKIIIDSCVVMIGIELIVAVLAFHLAQHIRNEKEAAASEPR